MFVLRILSVSQRFKASRGSIAVTLGPSSSSVTAASCRRSVRRDAVGDDDRTGHDLVVDARLEVGRTQEHVREHRRTERALGDGDDLAVDVLTDPRHRRATRPSRTRAP